jgi:signal transduction histidine kinase
VQGASRPERQANGDILWEGLLMDITVRKRTEELALRAREEAEQANRAKGEFLSRMSHELRTPLNAILGFGQLLEVDAKTPDDVESIQQILKAGRYLLGMINEVLNSAQIDTERTTTTLEEVNVTELLRETVESVRPLAFARDVHLKHVDSISEPHARADRHRLKEVVIELLSNAVKGSRAGGSVTVACDRRGTRTDATTRITISDCVQGFSSGKVVNLFAASESRDAARSLIQETELGLSLSKRTIELMGGRVIAEMEPEKGGTISIELLGAEFP